MRIAATILPLLLLVGASIGYASYRANHGQVWKYHDEINWRYIGFRSTNQNITRPVNWGNGNTEDAKSIIKQASRFHSACEDMEKLTPTPELLGVHTAALQYMAELRDIYDHWLEQLKSSPDKLNDSAKALVQKYNETFSALQQVYEKDFMPLMKNEFTSIFAPLYAPGYPNRYVPLEIPLFELFKAGALFNSLVLTSGLILIIGLGIYIWKRKAWLIVFLAWLTILPSGTGLTGYWIGYIKSLAIFDAKKDAMTFLDMEQLFQEARFTLELGLFTAIGAAALIFLASIALPPKSKSTKVV